MTDSSSSSRKPSSNGRVFAQRLLSTVVLWAVVLGALFAGNPQVSLLTVWIVLTALSAAAFHEFVKMFRIGDLSFGKTYFHAAGILYLTAVLFSDHQRMPAPLQEAMPHLLLGLIAFGCLYLLFHYRYELPRLLPLAQLLFGWFYIYFLAGYLIRIYNYERDKGAWILILFIVLTKFSDLGAYVTGSLIGKHKMIPKVSPGKTWEGFVGGIVFSALFGWGVVKLSGGELSGFPISHVLLLGVLLGTFAVLGDLVESLLKREADVKDSGQFLPGIGGALDLMDSLLFNAPIMYAYLCLFHASQGGA